MFFSKRIYFGNEELMSTCKSTVPDMLMILLFYIFLNKIKILKSSGMCELGADVNPAPNYETAEEDSESFGKCSWICSGARMKR